MTSKEASKGITDSKKADLHSGVYESASNFENCYL